MSDNLPVSTLRRYGERDIAIQEDQEEQKQARIAALGPDAKSIAFKAGAYREDYGMEAIGQTMLYGWSVFNKPNFPEAPEVEFTPDPDYSFDQDDANFGYDPRQMVYAQSEAEAFAMRTQIDYENAQMQIISDQGAGTWGAVIGSMLQPHVALSMALTPVSLPLAIGTEMGLEGASEALLHSRQLTRTKTESAFQIVFTGAAVGILGAGSRMLSKEPYKPDSKLIDDINEGAYEGELVVGTGADSASAMRAGSDISAAEDKLIGGKLADTFAIGQISNLVNSPARISRWVAQKLGDNPFFTEAHKLGKTHGVTVEAFNKAAMGKTVIAVERAVPMQKASGLKADDFYHEVGVAMSGGDRHLNPKVQEAAEMYRAEVVGPIREAAEKVGMLESSAKLQGKLLEIETQIKDIIKTGEAGAGSKKIGDAVRADMAKIEAAADKTTVKLQKKVDALEAKLAKTRGIGPDGKKNTAPASMIKQHNEARKLLTAHKKTIAESTKGQRAKIAAMKKQDATLKAARKAKRDIKSKLATGGTSFAESYFPRIYNQNKILKNWDRLAKLIEETFTADEKMMKQYGADKINEMVKDTMDNMMMGRYQNMTVKGEPSPTRARSLAIMDDVLEDFLEKNATEAMLRYTQSMQPHILFREVFENRSLSDLFDEISAEYRVMREKEGISADELSDLFAQEGKDKTNLQTMYDRLTNQVQRSVKPQSPVMKILQTSKVLNTAAMLGEIVLTSLPDLARPISHYGMRSFGKGVSRMVTQFMEGIDSVHSIQAKRLGAALQRTLNERAAQFADSLEPQGKWTQKTQKAWSRWSGFNMYTNIVESISAHAAMDYTLRAAKKVASKQPLSVAEKKQISRMGLDSEDLLAIWNESMQTMGAQEKNLKYMNTMAWQDVGLAKRVEAGIGSDIHRTIIQSGIGDKPAFMDDTTLSWLFQFQTFAMQAQNKIIVAGLQNMNRHTAEGFVTMLALGATVGGIKATIRGEDVSEWTADQWVMEGIDRSGMSGAMRAPLNMLRWTLATYGILDSAPSRYIDRELEGIFAPPAAGMAGNISRSVTSAIEGDFGTSAEKLVKTLPLNNLWGVRNTLMTLGDQ